MENKEVKINLSHNGLVGAIIANFAMNNKIGVVTIEDLLFFKHLLFGELKKQAPETENFSLYSPINFSLEQGKNREKIMEKWPIWANIIQADVITPEALITHPENVAVINDYIRRLATLSLYKGLQDGLGLYSNDGLWKEARTIVVLDKDYAKILESVSPEQEKKFQELLTNLELCKKWYPDEKLLKNPGRQYKLTISAIANEISGQSKGITKSKALKAISKALDKFTALKINDMNNAFIRGLFGKPNEANQSEDVEQAYKIGKGEPLVLPKEMQ